MIKFNKFQPEELSVEQEVQNLLFGENDYIPFEEKKQALKEAVEDHPDNKKRLVFTHDGPKKGNAAGIVVPRHMWESSKTHKGMKERNAMRANVYGKEQRPPLGLGQIEQEHSKTLEDHFKKPKSEQIKAEKAAVGRLKAAGHLDSGDTTDKGEKTDTVKHEYDEKGRSHVAASSKGVAGHALYTSGHGENEVHHVLNTCPGQTKGCGGGIDSKGLADTSKGTCFAPKAELQYKNASVRRACHAQAKHDPAMTNDWILAHTHSLRNRADRADKKNQRFLFRPNVVDETDRSSRHAIRHLNNQRANEGKPPIIGNSYGKTNEVHDPENNYHVTFSNIGPKVKNGKEISENVKRDSTRVRQTIHAVEGTGERTKDITNEQGNKTPPKNSYMVLNAKRDSPLSKQFEQHVTHAKYWDRGREEHELTSEEKKEGPEGHYDGEGKATTPDKSHYGHTTLTGSDGKTRRYDYQRQHILHPRMVEVGKNKDGTPHSIPTDSRFKDNDFLPKNRYKTKNGKVAGAILATTPTTSTSDAQHHTSFTHHVDNNTIEHAQRHNGEYEIDNPHEQEKARGKEYIQPSPIMIMKKPKKGNKVKK